MAHFSNIGQASLDLESWQLWLSRHDLGRVPELLPVPRDAGDLHGRGQGRGSGLGCYEHAQGQ